MAIEVTLFIIALLIITIWILIELKRFRHKMFAVFLIGLILFFYLSGVFVFKGREVDFKSISGTIAVTKIYFSWLGSVFVNLKSITTNVIKMNWESNKTIGT